jgi:predicted nucleotide-binding protein (sugar kinase/HSP70/actin superfamily)
MEVRNLVRPVTPPRPPLEPSPDTPLDIDAELARFEAEERSRLGLGPKRQWRDPLPQRFTSEQRAHTTILCGGLTFAHDRLIEGALSGLGYRVRHLEVPDNEALRFGKEMGNRGQCNPTYYTVGNLIKHLVGLRDRDGLPTERIIDEYLFVTGGACGPCRFGMYATEYRKALRDAGFDGFRVLLFQQKGGLRQATGEGTGLELNARFFLKLVQAILLGDVLNLIGYRLRPYEVAAGATDAALERCRERLYEALKGRHRLGPVLRRCRRELAAIAVDRTRVKPKVAIIGEFWAMTTEGDGNYRLQRFLEEEGAEVDAQPVTNWLLYLIWWERYRTRERRMLREGAAPPAETATRRLFAILFVAERVARAAFGWYARRLGLERYHLADMDAIAAAARSHYDFNVVGGEGHMEVGKFILSAVQRKSALVISVKPFGCMPSSGVSDGVQSYVTERHPQALFLPIETSGDGAVNVYSRVQMMLFKARALAREEVERAEADTGLSTAQARVLAQRRPWLMRASCPPAHSYKASTTAANFLYAAAAGWRGRLFRLAPTATEPAAGGGR